MPLRRVHLGSLIVIALALAGATAASSRHASRHPISMTWQAGDVRQARVLAGSERLPGTATLTRRFSATPIRPRNVQAPVRHQLFQRPPPYSSNTRSK